LSFFIFLGLSILLSKWAVHPVEQVWIQQRQFIGDASHELKTPLTVILTNAELAGNAEYSKAEREQFVKNIQTVSGHMKNLIEQMLTLSRADNSVEQPKVSSFCFGAAVSNVLLVFEAVLFETGHLVSVEIDDTILVSGDDRQLAQVVEILLDNAIKYAEKNGKIQITLKKSGHSHCLLTVANEGEPIPAEELKNLFKRFYRADTARSRDGSFGLGLSIAESIIIRHKGKIWAESKNGYNSFYVLLPTL
jgi:signal transduction histidine kinase